MPDASPCPAPETLDDLLGNRLPAERAEQVRTHVSGCPACRTRLGGETVAPRGGYPFLSPPAGPDELGRLGGYRVLGLLGEGGMSTVFAAEEPALRREVALKVLRPEYNDDITRQRFLREARAIASLPGEHVVHIYAVGEDNGVAFMAMERLRGESLAGRLDRDRSLPVVEALRIAREAAEGLAALHQRDLVHRDIKPGNLWLENGSDGRFKGVKVIDFGIARRVSADASLTMPGQVIGTPVWMAPEQASGRPVDARADLYSLGCVLYRMITGFTPFDHAGPQTMAVLQAVIKGDAPDIRQAAPTLSPSVAALIRQLMERDPAARPGSAEAVVERLREAEQEERTAGSRTQIIQAVSAGAVRREPRKAGRVGIVLGGLAVLAALAVGAAAVYQRFRPGSGGGAAGGAPVKVGVLFSQDGTTATLEAPLIDAVQLAVDQINDEGGVLGRRVEVVLADGASDEKVFAGKARDLIDDGAEVIFGCWTSSSRKRVAEVCKGRGRLLFYPCGDEGLEESPNVVYLGGAPNQSVIPLVRYAFADLRKRRFFLVGSEYLYSHALNEIIRHEIEVGLGAKVVGTRYFPLGETNVKAVVKEVADSKADFVLCSIDGTTSVDFFRALREAKLRPPEVTTAWAVVSETELAQFGTRDILDDYAAGCYFESLKTPANRAFLERYRKRFGPTKRVNDAMQTAYAGVHLWKQAVEKARSTEADRVREAVRGMTVEAPDGPLKIDAESMRAWRTARVAKVVRQDGRLAFEIVHQTPGPVRPDPFPAWRTRQQWQQFLDKLHAGWDGAWEKHRDEK